MRIVFPLLALALTACASSLPEGMKLIPQHEDPPEGCEELARVEARSERNWWEKLGSPVSHEFRARERLLRKAGKQGADTVYVTAHRAYRSKVRGDGIARVEIEGSALDCADG